MTKLSNNFSLEEMVLSQTATRLGIDNEPSPEIIENLKVTCAGLESVRALLGFPIAISSGYRSIPLNRAVGGVDTSAHCQGYAADILCPQFGSPYQVAAKIMGSDIKFDQCINEGNKNGHGGWTHVSFAPPLRMQVLTATFDAEGKASYSDGNRSA